MQRITLAADHATEKARDAVQGAKPDGRPLSNIAFFNLSLCPVKNLAVDAE